MTVFLRRLLQFLLILVCLVTALDLNAQVFNSTDKIRSFLILGFNEPIKERDVSSLSAFMLDTDLAALGTRDLPDLYELSLILQPFIGTTASDYNLSQIVERTNQYFQQQHLINVYAQVPSQRMKEGLLQIKLSGSVSKVANTVSGVVIYDSPEHVVANGITDPSLYITESSVSYVGQGDIENPAALVQIINPFIGRLVSMDTISSMESELDRHFTLDGSFFNAVVPQQNVLNGLVQIVIEGIGRVDPAEQLALLRQQQQQAAPAPDIIGVVMLGSPQLLGDSDRLTGGMEPLQYSGLKMVPDYVGLRESIVPMVGQPLKMDVLNDIKRRIVKHYDRQGYPFVSVTIPRQAVEDGIVELIVTMGKLASVKIEGNEHFSDEEIKSAISAKTGRPIDPESVSNDIKKLNQNPFIDANVIYETGSKAGETDLVVDVTDSKPYRLYANMDNYGSKLTGEERLTVGVNYGKPFNTAHLLNYQFTTDVDFDHLYAHSLSYVVPLPWNHSFGGYTSYSIAESTFDIEGLTQDGTSLAVGLFYRAPLADMGSYKHSVKGGWEYKQSDSSLFFNSLDVAGTLSDVFQFELGYEGNHQDSAGMTSFNASVYWAPGNLTEFSKQEEYTKAGFGDSSYYMGRFGVTRTTKLPADFVLQTKANLQYVSTQLPSSEQMGAGGNASVRGYDEREASGDNGFFLSNEVRTPAFKVGEWVGAQEDAGEVQFLTFMDYAGISTYEPRDTDTNPGVNLLSVGLGMRYTYKDNVTFNFDYGWQLRDSDVDALIRNTDNSRGHIYFNLSY